MKLCSPELPTFAGNSIGRDCDHFPLETRAHNPCSLLALAQGAGMYKLSRPHVTEDNVIHIKGGRCVL